MSGQYPPPNPPHPFSRAPHHQRAPTPWGHPSQSSVGSPMNFYGPPHMGMPGRDVQPWARPKPHDSHPRAANPFYGIPMSRPTESSHRRPSDCQQQQEETMDLSSHASVPAIVTPPQDTADVLRNGIVPEQPPEINGEVSRTSVVAEQVKDPPVTSVIASNPLRDSPEITETLSCSKVLENLVKKLDSTNATGNLDAKPVPTGNLQITCAKSDNLVVDSNIGLSADRLESSILKTSCDVDPPSVDLSAKEQDSPTSPLDNCVEEESCNSSDGNSKSCEASKPVEPIDSAKNVDTSFESNRISIDRNNQSDSYSFMENSTLSIDTDESKLVVAESSTDDIFGLSPNPSDTLQETKSADGSAQPSSVDSPQSHKPIIASSVPSAVKDEGLSGPVIKAPPEPNPSVENVETLLESMFNSQDESSCNSQVDRCNVSQSAIVSNDARMPSDIKPIAEMTSPIKIEELAQTLAGGSPGEIKDEKVEAPDELNDDIERKLEILTDSNSTNQLKPSTDPPLPISSEKDKLFSENNNTDDIKNALLSNNIKDIQQSDSPKIEDKETPPTSTPSTSQSDAETLPIESKVETLLPRAEASTSTIVGEAGTSSNPFIEVETELEKMFAGIVEPTEETGDAASLLSASGSEPKKNLTNKRPVAKRKKANSRRVSDNSFFGCSSGESTPAKKRGRKRVNDSGSERGSKKMKTDSVDSLKKGRLPRDGISDSLGKVKGPFVHIEGSKESPASVVVVNSGVRADDDDGVDKTNARKKHSIAQRIEGAHHKKAARVYNSSAMSARYNSDKADLTWVCVFCKRGPHCVGGLGGEPAGDLFGPYRVPATPPHDDRLPHGTVSDKDLVEEQKRRGGKFPQSIRTSGGADAFIHKMAKKNKRSMSGDSVDQAGLLAVDGGYEVWLHAQCAEWAPGLCIIGTQVVGLDDAVWTALRTRCTRCGESGAGIGCVVRSCPTRMHYPCAVDSGWLLDTDTFIARCHVHRTRLRPS